MLFLSCVLKSGWPVCRYLQRRRDKKGPTFTYEVIVVDDGSTDATVRTAMEYVRRCDYSRLLLALTTESGFACACLSIQ